VDPRVGLDGVEKRKFLTLIRLADQETEETQPHAPKAEASSQVWEQRGRKKKRDLNSEPSVVQPVASRYTDYAVSAPV
jgi:hypothetical protein